MVTIITSHLGEQEQGEGGGGVGGRLVEEERKMGWRYGMKTLRHEGGCSLGENKKIKCQILGTVQKCQRRRG